MNSILRELLIDATEISENYEKGTIERVVDYKIFAELIVMECAMQTCGFYCRDRQQTSLCRKK